MDSDPTPGWPEEVRELAEELQEFADDVGEALGKIRGMASDRAVLDWAGLTADAFRTEFDGVPENLAKLQTSYDMAADALARYWPKLESAQALADRALERAIAAQADLQAAQGQLADGEDWVSRAGDEAERLQDQARRESTPEPPSEEDVRTAVRDHQAAQAAVTAAQGRVAAAEDALAAARELARQAQEMREEAARECARDIDAASDAGIQNRRWWERVIDWVRDNWDTIVGICKLVVAVLGVVVMIIGGPLAWVVLAAALIVLADTLVKYARGQATLWDVAFAALDCIPGMKGLTTLGGLARGMRSLATTGLRGLRQGVLGMGRAVRRMGRSGDNLVCRTDPIDMATGEMVMSAVDVELPGVLPLVLERHHRSSLREGTWFGPSWASTLDQRLVLDEAGLRFVTADGMVLDYPRPLPGEPVMPVEGPRWGLSWNGDPGTAMTVHQPGTGRTLHFAPVPGRLGGELPLTAITDRNNNTIRVTYDASGAPAEVVHDGGYRIGVTTEAGRITAYRLLNAPDQPVLLRFGYDEHGNLAQIYNSSGLPHTFAYDDRHRITGWEGRNGTWYRYTYDDEGRCVATDGTDGYLSSRIVYDTDTHRTLFTDSLGHTTVYQFNDSYQLTTETDPLGHTIARAFDRYDRLLSLTDQLGRTTSYSYDDLGNVVQARRPDSACTTLAYNEQQLLTACVEPSGARWEFTYDAHGNRLTATDPTGATTRYTYTADGRLSTVTDPVDGVQRFETNRAGLVISASTPTGQLSRVERDAQGRVVASTDSMGATTAFRWTPEGRVEWCRLPDGSEQEWTYDAEGNLLEHRDSTGAISRFEYTHFDLLAARFTADGAVTRYHYDTELRRTRVVSPAGTTWDYTYDFAGNVTQQTDYHGRRLAYVYDAVGQLAEYVNGAGQMIRYRRDELGRVRAVESDTGTAHYEYDAAGLLVHAANEHSALDMRYDLVGNVTEETVDGRSVTSVFDAVGRRIQRTTASGLTSRFAYDADHQLARLATAGREISLGYDPLGRNVGWTLPGAVTVTQEWDANHRLTAQAVSGRQRIDRTYRYRADGAVTSRADSSGPDLRFELDPLGRITAVHQHTAEGPSARFFAYDALGNRRDDTTPELPSAGEPSADGDRSGALPRRVGRTGYEYDAQGRVIRRSRRLLSGGSKVWNYEWDAHDRLIAVITPDGRRWRYLYDPLGRRTAKQLLSRDDGETVVQEIRFTWDGTRLAEQSAVNAQGDVEFLSWEWQEGEHRPIAQVETRLTPTSSQEDIDRRFYAIVTDIIGTPTELIGDDGRVAWRNDADVWGARPSPLASARSPECPLGFPGQYHDPESGLHYNYHRYYDPEAGRYLSADPLGLLPGLNPYAYVLHPLVWSDPLGLAGCRPDPTWGGRVQFGQLDSLGRPTGIRATITGDMIGEGTAASSRIRPPGFAGGPPVGPHARGHLLGRQLGGSGSVRENLVTLFQNPVNTPIMAGFEGQVRRMVENGEIVQYMVTPIYDGANLIPRAVTMEAFGSGGSQLSVSILNRQ
ncbi:DUF6531 domain-containing protein [Streptomyces sp. URMC 129]|uniref:DUF6531 domain-containing protein n=1 Tax=Streptomyces sp. URMC 129 TaxID=3423407 RepID=UPI003F1D26AA